MKSQITGSDTAHINAISMPTEYYTMAFVDGELLRIGKNNSLYTVEAPETPITNPDGSNYTLDQARAEGLTISDSFSDVSWRTPFGANMQFPTNPVTFFNGLEVAAPDVNTIRVDFNAATLNSPKALAEFRDFTGEAAERGYQLIIQYSDGQMSGRQTPDASSYHSKTPDPSGRMGEIGAEWAEVIQWFEQPEQAAILDAVYGWELINEPMAYGRTPAAGKTYAQDIVSIVQDHGIDWHGKKILVGGLGASGRFENIDHGPIRDAIGKDLVWSVHAYPNWNNPDKPDLNGTRFAEWLEKHISHVFGDDILLTEMNLGRPDEDGDGRPDLLDIDGGNWAAFNAARTFQFLSEEGIGVTYWAANSRGSSFLLNGGNNTLIGGDGNDWIEAYQGRNVIDAGAGNDIIITSGGSTVTTGEGQDLIYMPVIDGQNDPLRITDFSEEDRLDLTEWANSGGKLSLQLDRAGFGDGREGLSLTIPGIPGFAVVFDPESGFSGLGSLIDTGIEIEIDDRSGAEAAGAAFDPDTGTLTMLEGPDEETVTPPDPDLEPGAPPEPGTGTPNDPNEPSPPDEEDEEEGEKGREGSGGACFVATAAYGGAAHPDVVALRAFRDRHLVRHPLGRAFIRFYWVVGPHMARRVNPESRLAAGLRSGLGRMVRRLRNAGLC